MIEKENEKVIGNTEIITITDDFKEEFTTLSQYEVELNAELEVKKDIVSLQNMTIVNKQNIAKWSARKSYHKLSLAKYQSELIDRDADIRIKNTLIRSGEPVILSAQQINKLADSDEVVQDLNYTIKYIHTLIEFCESAEKTLNGLSFDLRELINLSLFEQGFNRK